MAVLTWKQTSDVYEVWKGEGPNGETAITTITGNAEPDRLHVVSVMKPSGEEMTFNGHTSQEVKDKAEAYLSS